MTYRLAPFFPHRRNPDGTLNSICLRCLETVASHKTEEELKELDKQHVCSTTRSRRETKASASLKHA